MGWFSSCWDSATAYFSGPRSPENAPLLPQQNQNYSNIKKLSSFGLFGLFIAIDIVTSSKLIADYDEEGAAAGAVTSPFITALVSLMLGFAYSAGIETGTFIGTANKLLDEDTEESTREAEEKYKLAGHMAKSSWLLNTMSGGICTAAMLSTKSIFPHVFSSATAERAASYCLGASWSPIPILMIVGDTQIAFQEGDWAVPALSGLALSLINAGSSYLLGFEAGMGALGIGLGFSISSAVVAVLIKLWFLREDYKKYEFYTNGVSNFITSFTLENFSVEELNILKALSSQKWQAIDDYKEELNLKIQAVKIETAQYKKEKFTHKEVGLIAKLLGENDKKDLSTKLVMSNIKKLLASGWLISLQRLTEWGNLLLITTAIGASSNEQLAAASPAVQYIALMGALLQSLSQGAGLIISESQGALAKFIKDNNSEQANEQLQACRRILKNCILAMLGFSSIVGVAAYFPRESIVKFFISKNADSNVISLAENIFVSVLIGFLPDAARIVGIGGLRGWKDFKYPTFVNLAIMIASIPICFGMGNRLHGDSNITSLDAYMFYGRAAALVTAALAMMHRCHTQLKKDEVRIRTTLFQNPPSSIIEIGNVVDITQGIHTDDATQEEVSLELEETKDRQKLLK